MQTRENPREEWRRQRAREWDDAMERKMHGTIPATKRSLVMDGRPGKKKTVTLDVGRYRQCTCMVLSWFSRETRRSLIYLRVLFFLGYNYR